MQGAVREIAVEIVRSDGTILPALINSVVRRDEAGRPRVIGTSVFDATDRRRYEQELLRNSQREREIALALQRSLLSGELPSSAELGIEVFYASASAGLEIGGDWYDAFWLEPSRCLALVVGDVVGRGLSAAATMGQLRSAVRALASTELGPGEVLDAVDAYSRRHAIGDMTTLAYAKLDLETRQLQFACAGHPPPLIAEPGSEPRLAWGGRSMPINAYGEAGSRSGSVLTLKPGAVLMLYTDGLVEHRHRPALAGIEQLARVVGGVSEAPLGAMVESIVAQMHDPGVKDDRCVLAVRVEGGSPESNPIASD
jgi:serine/threonine-protein kinase RsbW